MLAQDSAVQCIWQEPIVPTAPTAGGTQHEHTPLNAVVKPQTPPHVRDYSVLSLFPAVLLTALLSCSCFMTAVPTLIDAVVSVCPRLLLTNRTLRLLGHAPRVSYDVITPPQQQRMQAKSNGVQVVWEAAQQLQAM